MSPALPEVPRATGTAGPPDSLRAGRSPAARQVLPEFTERTGGGSRTLDPYAKLLEERIVVLSTPLDDITATDVVAQLLCLEYAAPERDISLYLNSPGGTVTAMTAVYDTLTAIGCDVETVCVGQVASTAAVLLAAGTPGKRLVLPAARVVLRQPALEETYQGRAADLDIHARELLRQREQLAELLRRHTGQCRERIDADIERDTVLDATAARAYGLADHVVSARGR
ncbi:ATP-dependent Clp protease proteolytic subunit [Streptomyces sp. LP05-1]|uniref:ATP-dependent Clp protease proteolytic subunit n=1 Tax=Streptomyces pyxinae TaxID=2970734 RepID=A0ABT2CE41_9ACTN|nr:ATP-dependent Clp protease proteolytic subunit [Streptomyces sp. LP05-1]MCS0635677.1 ATP-dependent Clp protease proteolytic subunit [Streptomyces sp. LP05-1]